jgi:hypothetical protein
VKPYKLIETADPNLTLGEGDITHHPSMIAAANAFAHSTAPYKQVIYDNGHIARELNKREQALLERVCELLGYEIEQVNG